MSRAQAVSPNQFCFDLSPAVLAPIALSVAVSSVVNLPQSPARSAATLRNRQKLAVKLRGIGEDLVGRAEVSASRPRLANTRRRAAMASSAEQSALEERALGRTMINIAAAIEAGEANALMGFSSKAAIESLISELRCVETYARQAGRTLNSEAINSFARIHGPRWGLSGSSWERTVAVTEGLEGAERFRALITGAEAITGQALELMFELLGKEKAEYELGWYNVSRIAHLNRLKRAGIETDDQLKAALQELIIHREERQSECPLKAAMRKLVGRSVGIDFFPTPAAVCARMVEIAAIRQGMKVLEPSAGCGNIADAARDAGAEVDVIEISGELRDILALKGHSLVGFDFDDFEVSAPYADAVLMNPPFGKRSDARHIRKAYSLVKPGGVLVGIASEGLFFGTDAEATSFRHWLDEVGGVSERLPDGTFMDPSLPVRTGVSARIVTIFKADDEQ